MPSHHATRGRSFATLIRLSIMLCVLGVVSAMPRPHQTDSPDSDSSKRPFPKVYSEDADAVRRPLQPKVPYTGPNPNYQLWSPPSVSDYEAIGLDGVDPPANPEPKRAGLGASILGPDNLPLDYQNADALAPPTTDHGSVPNFKWPFSLSHNRIERGGWARQQNVKVLPSAKDIASVNMRLKVGAIREMHWHVTAEWAYVLAGTLRVSTITPDGKVWVDDVSKGDLWYFPAGNPHSIQALPCESSPDGAEFLLIFDDGNFSEDSTFLLTDWLAHVPKEVLSKNLGYPDYGEREKELFGHIPEKELYIFESQPPPQDISRDKVVPNTSPNPFTYHLSRIPPEQKQGGTVKIVDSSSFVASKKIALGEVEIEVGGLRELHWHPSQPEWTYFVCGQGRITLFASGSDATTLDFYPGDVAYIPPTFGHYIENTGNETLKILEILKTDRFEDISLRQWLALTPRQLVKAHLGLDDEVLDRLGTEKLTLVK